MGQPGPGTIPIQQRAGAAKEAREHGARAYPLAWRGIVGLPWTA